MKLWTRFQAVNCVLAALVTPFAVLADDGDRTDPEEAVIDESPSFSISGEHRARVESLDQQFRPFLDESDQVLALRTSLVVSATWPRWHVVGEFLDSRAELNDINSTLDTTVVNALEPLQALVTHTWTNASNDGSQASLSIGRMTMDLGTQRLVARSAYRNTADSFMGLNWTWRGPAGHVVQALYLAPMLILPRARADVLANEPRVDDIADKTRLAGVHYRSPLFDRKDGIELYWLALDAKETLDIRHLTTVGARIYRPASVGKWHYDIEIVRQTGRSSALVGGELRRGLQHDAKFYHIELGYSFTGPWSPNIGILYDLASGDKNPTDARNERFDTLYGTRSFELGSSGIYGPFARANLETPGVRMTLQLAERWQATLSYRKFRLASPRDAWTTTGLRDPTGQSGNSLGHQSQASFSWSSERGRLTVDVGAARFSKGSFIELTAPERTQASVYYYAATTITF